MLGIVDTSLGLTTLMSVPRLSSSPSGVPSPSLSTVDEIGGPVSVGVGQTLVWMEVRQTASVEVEVLEDGVDIARLDRTDLIRTKGIGHGQ